MRGEWGGAEDPPLEELERLWAREAIGDGGATYADTATWDEPAPMDVMPRLALSARRSRRGGLRPTAWSTRPSDALLDLERKLARARRAVETAEIADAADQDSWEQSPEAPISARPTRCGSRARLDGAAGGSAPPSRAHRRRGLVDRPRIAVTDALTGALLALTDARELRARGTCTRPACRRGPRSARTT